MALKRSKLSNACAENLNLTIIKRQPVVKIKTTVNHHRIQIAAVAAVIPAIVPV